MSMLTRPFGCVYPAITVCFDLLERQALTFKKFLGLRSLPLLDHLLDGRVFCAGSICCIVRRSSEWPIRYVSPVLAPRIPLAWMFAPLIVSIHEKTKKNLKLKRCCTFTQTNVSIAEPVCLRVQSRRYLLTMKFQTSGRVSARLTRTGLKVSSPVQT